jgi:DNA-directed RNA polymerase subunit beta
MSFGRIDEVLDLPDLVEIQKDSYQWFLHEGLDETFADISPIEDYSGNMALTFVSHQFGEPKYDIDEAKERDSTYSAPLRVKVQLVNKVTGEVKEQEVFMGDFPIMTEHGTFVYNGAERAVVSQLVRSPGAYFGVAKDTNGVDIYSAQLIPNRGAWLELETDSSGAIFARIDRTRKVPYTVFLRAVELAHAGTWAGTNSDVESVFGVDSGLGPTFDKDATTKRVEGLFEIHKRLRPGEPPTEESAKKLLFDAYFDPRRYDLARVGRYKLNSKLALRRRIVNRIAGETVVAGEALLQPENDGDQPKVVFGRGEQSTRSQRNQGDALCQAGDVLVKKGDRITREIASRLAACGFNEIYIQGENGVVYRLIGNGLVRQNWQDLIRGKRLADDVKTSDGRVLLPAGQDIADQSIEVLTARFAELAHPSVKVETRYGAKQIILTDRYVESAEKALTAQDIVALTNYLLGLMKGVAGNSDDIDHLGNRRLRTVGELLQNQFRVGLSRMERVVRERMSIQDVDSVTPQNLINIRPVVAAIKEFFGSSQLSQFMDQTNPLAELTHKRRLSALGPGGLSRERAGVEVRDVHHSHYGRICPIETPEGPNVGLIGYLATFARVNKYGFVETPYRVVDKQHGVVTNEVVYLTADEEDDYIVAQANEPLDENGGFTSNIITCRYRQDVMQVQKGQVDFMDVSPKQVFSVSTTLIPFLEHDDAGRALMGSNMMKQAVPLIRPRAPYVGTGMEYKAATDSGSVVLAKAPGVVRRATASEVTVQEDIVIGDDVQLGRGLMRTYKMQKFQRSNQGTCINQKPVVHKGEHMVKGQVIADGPATDEGELALGRNVLCAFMPWGGYNYEDAILLSERVVKEDIFTSIHIEEYEADARDTKLGPEEITRDIPNVGNDAIADLDEEGIIRIGAEVHPGDILVGKVTPKGETELTAEERLLRAIFGEKAREVRDTSTRVPHGESGRVVDVKKFSRENNDELPPGVNKLVRVYVAQKRKISEGDKMAGRHGNKGVVARILPAEDMPFLADGTPVDIVLNPLGVPSRMNIGQVLETHLGWAAEAMGMHMATPVFDGATEGDIADLLEKAGLPRDGKTTLYDGRTGEAFDNPVTVGQVYMLKLFHLVDDKIHARSTGPYSLVTQQPLGGKAQFGGQRFGEMEVWALEAYGASYTLRELLTVKSDDVTGRVNTYEAIVKGENIPDPGIPESFKVLVKELQSLGMDVKVLNADGNEVELAEDLDEQREMRELNLNIEGEETEGEHVVHEAAPPAEEEEEGEDAALAFDEDRLEEALRRNLLPRQNEAEPEEPTYPGELELEDEDDDQDLEAKLAELAMVLQPLSQKNKSEQPDEDEKPSKNLADKD